MPVLQPLINLAKVHESDHHFDSRRDYHGPRSLSMLMPNVSTSLYLHDSLAVAKARERYYSLLPEQEKKNNLN